MLDPQKTAPFELGPEVPRGTVLLVHGFTGSPWDVRPLGEVLAADGFRVKGIRLSGHGTTPEALASTGRGAWLADVERELLQLSERGPVHLAGLSMGALLAVLCAARHPRRVRSLLLMAPALRFASPAMALVRALRHWPVIERLRPWERKRGTDIEDEQARREAPVLPRIPTARVRDLCQLQDATVEAMARVRAPALISCADNDHVVAVSGARELARGLRGPVRLVRLARGFHILPRDRSRDVLFDEARTFLAAHAG